MEKLTKDEYREQAAARVAAAQALLAAEVTALVTGDDWRRFLDAQAHLYDYDANDVMLIRAQHAQAHAEGRVPEPTPSYIADFDTWAALDRHVERGQHGYTVLRPLRSTRREAKDAEGNVRVLRRGEAPGAGETETRTTVLSGFRPKTVFDAGQTSGAALSEAPHPRLVDGQAPPGLGAAVLHLIEEHGWKVTTVPDATWIEGADSRVYYGGKFITIRGDLDDAATVTTLVQGAAHVVLHEGRPGRYLPAPVKEVEAASVAYVVASVHGMSTDDYDFPYIAAWAGEDTDRAIGSTQARVASAAQMIIAASPAEHETGSTPLGTDLAVAAARQQRQEAVDRTAELRSRLAGQSDEPTPPASPDWPELA